MERAYGLITMQADGSSAYALKSDTPDVGTGVEAHDLFSYTVSDGHGGLDTAHLDIVVHGAPYPGAL